MQKTSIEWTGTPRPDGTLEPGFTANPLKFRDESGKVVWGCVHASLGCKNCYAEALAHRYGKGGPFNVQTMAKLTPFLDENELHKMLTAQTIQGTKVSGSRCFVGDMTDIFGPWVPDELIDRLFAVFALRSDVTWQLLTKRAERMRTYLTAEFRSNRVVEQMITLTPKAGAWSWPGWTSAFRHVWLGVSAEDQQRADERIPHLLQTPAVVRFVSAEPLLGPIDLKRYMPKPLFYCSRCGKEKARNWCEPCGTDDNPATNEIIGIDWVIPGGESGAGARVSAVEWVRGLVRQCADTGTACLVKQLGSRPAVVSPSSGSGLSGSELRRAYELERAAFLQWPEGTRFGNPTADPARNGTIALLKSRKGGDMSEWPADLRVRQFPGEAR